jgi:undecaprenol kinase
MKKFWCSIASAWNGVKYVFNNEQNFRLQFFCSILVVIISLLLNLTRYERIVVYLLIFSILILEIINSAIEKFADVLKPRMDYHVKIIKDIAAAMVFLASIGSIIIGLMVFSPHIMIYIRGLI